MALAVRIARFGFLCVVVVYLGALIALAIGQDRVLYPRPTPHPLDLTRLDPAAHQLWATVDDGRLPVLVAPGSIATIVWFHGNAGQLSGLVSVAATFNEHDFGFAGIELAGYGLSEGLEPNEQNILAGATAGMEALVADGALAGGRPTCVGHSLGTAVAVAMAEQGWCDKVVLLAPFTSVLELARAEYWYFPVQFLLRDPWNSGARAPDVTVRSLVVHGRQDDTVPVAMGEAMCVQMPDCQLLEFDGGHNDVLSDQVYATIAQFAAEGVIGNGEGPADAGDPSGDPPP